MLTEVEREVVRKQLECEIGEELRRAGLDLESPAVRVVRERYQLEVLDEGALVCKMDVPLSSRPVDHMAAVIAAGVVELERNQGPQKSENYDAIRVDIRAREADRAARAERVRRLCQVVL